MLSDVEVLGLRPGDTLVIHTPHAVTVDEAKRLKAQVAGQLPFAVPIIVAPADVVFVVVRPAGIDSD